jgi:hypothetical protein
LLERLGKQIELTADQSLVDLMRELKSYPGARQAERGCNPEIRDYAGVVVPLELNIEGRLLTLFSTTTVFVYGATFDEGRDR